MSDTIAPPVAIEGTTLVLRPLEAGDYHRGYLGLLQHLTVVGDVSEEQFAERLRRIEATGTIKTTVIEDTALRAAEETAARCVVATGTLVVEPKFIHACGVVGHVEDIVVNPECRGQQLGRRMVDHLCREAKERYGCYKCLLVCNEPNLGFYEKLGFKQKDCQMRRDL